MPRWTATALATALLFSAEHPHPGDTAPVPRETVAPIGLSGTADSNRGTATVTATSSGYEETTEGRKAKPVVLPPTKYVRADAAMCSLYDLDTLVDVVTQMGGCTDGRVQTIIPAPCPDGTYPLAALWVQHLQEDNTYGPAELHTDAQCVTPADIAAQAQTAFTSMTVPTPHATLQPERDVLLINVWHPVHTSAEPVTQTATLLDVPVEIRAVPAEFTWDFDDPFSPDGGTLTTTDPGRPWVDGDPMPDEHWIGHAWTRLGDPDTRAGQTAGATYDDDTGNKYRTDVTVTLTTTWHGQFRIAGTLTWTDIPGQLTTTSAAGTYTITEARSHLYCDDLHGTSACGD